VNTVFDTCLSSLALVLGQRLRLQAVVETGSTNTDLLEACRQRISPQLLVAQKQTAGRGRLGRQWQSQPGEALTFSLAWPLQPGTPLDGLSLAVGVALAEALDPEGQALRLKWPNDLWLNGRKLGGVLIETLVQPQGPQAVVVGVGLNTIAPVMEPPAAGLQQLDPRWTPPLALAAVVPPLVELLERWQGFAPAWQSGYAARDALQGRQVAGDGVEGVAEGVSADGLLRLRDASGRIQLLRAGEARLREVSRA
jgi:BirA family biotin operon repressor/biotin-[acetyl-CoA-carboxylase] ligase